VAYLPQRDALDWRFPISVQGLVLTGRYVHLGWLRRARAPDRAIVTVLLDRLGIGALAERHIGELSGGQQQRALLARALAQEADLLLLDEPLNAVDAETRAVLEGVLGELRREGKTAVVATHDLGRLETDFDGALYLRAGRETAPPPGGFAGLAVGREALWVG
jgi:manganese/zinc/iron transport system ATP- binding protein